MDADREALFDLVVSYSMLADAHDGLGVASLFMPDGCMELYDDGLAAGRPNRTLQGRLAIASMIDELEQFRATMHFLGQHRAELLVPDTGYSETYCEASHVFVTGEGAFNHVVGLRYLDEYSHTMEGWRFVRRRLDFAWVEQRKLATAAQIARVPGRNRRL